MEHYGKKVNVNKGLGFTLFFITLFPILIFLLFYYIFNRYTDYANDITLYMTLGFTGMAGSLFYVVCMYTGYIHDLVVAMFRRLKELFGNIKIFKGLAFKWYFEEFIRKGGIILWFFLLVFFINVFLAIFGFVNFFSWYNSIK